MVTKGRFLEILVKFIESNLSPHDVTITSPERFYSSGKQIGEIDITIRGKFGSAIVFVGIECRDRPSEGPQGIDWIELLAGKKSLLKVDKMVAVSTTGFRAEAVEAAKQFNIDLLTISDVTQEELSNLIRFEEVSMVTYRYEFKEPLSGLVPVDRAEFFKNDFSEVKVIHKNKEVSFQEYIQAEIRLAINQFDVDVQLNGEEVTLTRLSPIQALLPDGPVEINDFVAKVLLWREVATGKVILTAYRKPGSDGVIAYTGVCRMRLNNRELVILYSLDDLSPSTGGRLRAQLVDENGQPFFPTGTIITLKFNNIFQESK